MVSNGDEGKGAAFSRAQFLRYSLAGMVAVWAGTEPPFGVDRALAEKLFYCRGISPKRFPLSVASGDPSPHGIVLWTRVDPGVERMKEQLVGYEISADRNFRKPLLRGVAKTGPERDYTVKVQIAGRKELRPFSVYYYRFIHGRWASRTGRFKTLPEPDQQVPALALGYVSCQDYTNGYYTAFAHLAQEDVDYVVHLGDYIYETTSAGFQGGQVRTISLPGGSDRARTLSDYRFLYRTYRSDRNLQKVQENFAMIAIWDDHEFANDCYQAYDDDTSDPKKNFAPRRRKNASRAWAEYMPVGVPFEAEAGALGDIVIYRSVRFGRLAELILTDERLYRDAHPCGESTPDKYLTPGCGREKARDRSMLGQKQRRWFLNRLETSPARWKLWANEVMFMQFKLLDTYLLGSLTTTGLEDLTGSVLLGLTGSRTGDGGLGAVAEIVKRIESAVGGVYLNLDQWDGFQAERSLILERVKRKGVENLVLITGDIHSFAAGYAKKDFENPFNGDANVVAPEFVGGSITSSNLTELLTSGKFTAPPKVADFTQAVRIANPHMLFFDSSTHGYNVMRIEPAKILCTMKAVESVKRPHSGIKQLAAFEVSAGSPLISRVG